MELKKFFTSKLASLTDEVSNLESELSSLLKELEQNKIKTVGEIESLNKKIKDLKKQKGQIFQTLNLKKLIKKRLSLSWRRQILKSEIYFRKAKTEKH